MPKPSCLRASLTRPTAWLNGNGSSTSNPRFGMRTTFREFRRWPGEYPAVPSLRSREMSAGFAVVVVSKMPIQTAWSPGGALMAFARLREWLTWPILAVGLTLVTPSTVRAHCDGLDGPVVKAAQKALETRNA